MNTAKKTTHKKPEIKKEPLPKEGTFWKYFFWYISTYKKSFITILFVIFFIVFILSSDIGFYEDTSGNWKFTIDKKAMQWKTMKTNLLNKEEKK